MASTHPAPATSADLLALAERAGLAAADTLSQKAGPLPDDPRAAAETLVAAGLLTRFQAKLLLKGRFRGFKLGPYTLLDELGSGGMGAVYLAEHTDLRRRVAVKVLTPPKESELHTLARERFLREARSAAALDHPNIVRIHDVGRQGDVQFLVMEHVEGRTLDQLAEKSGPFPPATAAGYVAQAARGLQHAFEKGLVHRDIKPGNLMLAADGTVKLLDLGLARSVAADGDDLTQALDKGAVVGTADYISPEQANNLPGLDTRADIYSLGATLYALLAGKPPFEGTVTQKLSQHLHRDPPPLPASVPEGLTLVVARMLAKKPADRFQTPAEVADALAPWAAPATAAEADANAFSDLSLPTPPKAAPPPAPPRRRKRWPLVGVAAGLLAVVAGGAVVLSRPGGAKPTAGYTLDLTGLKPFDGQLRGGDPFPPGKLPAGWAGQVAKAGAVGEFALSADPAELSVGLVGGEGPVRLVFDPHKAGLRPAGGWVVRLEYTADAGTAAKLTVTENNRVVASRDLPAADKWAKVGLPFRSAGSPRVAVEAAAGGDGQRVRVRAVELAAE